MTRLAMTRAAGAAERATARPSANELGPNEAMLLNSTGSGKGPWLSPAKNELYQKLYDRDVGAH